MLEIQQFRISDECLQKLQDISFVEEHFRQGKTLQELFGFSNSVTAEFYEAARNILEQRRFEEALCSFLFLTTLNPYISDFWLGLGMSQRMTSDYDSALYSYHVACSLDKRKIGPYMLGAQCCMEMRDFDRAVEFVAKAEAYASENPQDELSPRLRQDAAAAKQYIEAKRI